MLLLLLCILITHSNYSDPYYLCLPAAGIDLLLPNRSSATLRFSRKSPRATVNIAVLCDGTVEEPDQSCTLRFSTIAVPEHARGILIVFAGREAVLDIIECVDECEFAKIRHNLREDKQFIECSYMQHTHIHIHTHTSFGLLVLKGHRAGSRPGSCFRG